MGIALLQPMEAQEIKQPNCATVVLTWTQAKASVLPRREVGEQGIVLKHHAHSSALRRNPVLPPRHDAVLKMNGSLIRPFKACD
jgi:hypothetical protein